MRMDDQVRYYKAKLQYEIDPWDLNEALGRGDKIHLVDTRSPEAYGRSHIPGAINIPHRTMSTATTAHLDKEALVVTQSAAQVPTRQPDNPATGRVARMTVSRSAAMMPPT